MRFRIGRRFHGRAALAAELHLERSGDGLRNLVLNREDVGQFAVIAFGPKMTAVGRGDQLRGDADASAGAPHAAFENVGHAQRIGDAANVLLLALEGERRSARDHLETRDLCQRIQ